VKGGFEKALFTCLEAFFGELNMRGILYTQEKIDEFIRKGYWDWTTRADLVDRNAREFPDEEAVVDVKGRLTWSDLSRQSDLMALGLLDLGLQRDDVVLTLLPNWADVYIVLLACEKAGIIIAPVQHTFRQAEIEPVLNRLNARAIIIPTVFRNFDYFKMASDMKSHVPSLEHIIVAGDEEPEGTICLEEIKRKGIKQNLSRDHLNQTRFDPFDVANITLSSGTTGVPKCVDAPICFRLCAARKLVERWKIGPHDNIGVFYNMIGGGASTISQFAAPFARAKIILMDVFDPRGACEVIEREKITIAAIVPALMARLLDYPDLEKHNFSSLRLMHNSTSYLPYELGVKAEEKLGARYVQTYGTAESSFSPISTHSLDDPQEIRIGTLGRPAYEGTFKIVDEKHQEVPRGEIGEIAINGPCCTSGYFRDEKLTREDWRDGWFYTGNDGKFDEWGNVIVLGRKREVIIRGGQNIYPGEIENLLTKHPKVNDVSVVGMPDRVMGEKVCAYIIPKEGQRITFIEMVSYLKEKRLAPFKLPERLEIIDKFPMVPAGHKVDKVKLEKDIARKLESESKTGG
jgi:non-ribosomal peptide synthetase component E (peptide arylation enzyme)